MRPVPVWDHLVCDETVADTLVAALGINPVVARVLVLRGIVTPDEATRFLNPSLDHLHDPFTLTDVPAATDRIFGAIARGERIAVHGDYDVDGVTSTVMLRRAIELLGGDVVHYIPDRLKDGYGLLPEAIERLHADDVRVVISVDCGIRAADAARQARAHGIDLIITDHHEPGDSLPPAFAVINPRRSDCAYPDKDLAGVGVAFKLVQALCARSDRLGWLPGFVKLAAIGTVADVVPLRGENRVIAHAGLGRLSRGRHTVGLRALVEAAGLTGKRIGSHEVSFVLAPRLNAAGRMSTPDLATRLLLISDEGLADEARGLAEQLDTENLRRREEEARILADARRRIEADPEIGAHNLVVVWGEGWHRGVIGIVASKLVEQFCRPAVVLSVEDGVAHGSGRSIPGFDLLAALERCADLFNRFGGHRQAAGVTLDAGRLPELRRRLGDYADERLSPEDLMPRLAIDAALPLGQINGDLVRSLGMLEPFGAGNRRPVFHAAAVEVVDGPHTMRQHHLRMTVRAGRSRFRAIAWRAGYREAFVREHRAALNMAFSLTENSFRGETHLELSVADVK
jgi:single-stranded-DNA-specific exonuclease